MHAAERLQKHFPLLVLLACLAAIVSRVWVAEDGYITFRAVENLYAGYGLVYNPGENIEVFTHPLWMMVLVLIRGAGLPLHFGSILAGLVFCCLALVILIFRRSPVAPPPGASDSSTRVFPFAALALCAVSGFRDFATAGMEFSLVFLLLTLLYDRLEAGRITPSMARPGPGTSCPRGGLVRFPGQIATLLALLYLTRPELALLAPYYSAFFVIELLTAARPGDSAPSPGQARRLRLDGFAIRRALLWGLPFLLLVGGYHLFRFWYYNDVFPNTYYAKAGLSSNYFQGLAYLIYTILWAPSLWIVLGVLGLFPLLEYTRRLLAPREYLPLLRDTGAALLLILYVVRVGGDFMSFRFLLPEMTILALVADRFFRRINPDRLGARLLDAVRRRGWSRTHQVEDFAFYIRGGTLLLFGLLLLFPVPYSRGYVADERQVFTKGIESSPLDLFVGQNYPWGKTGREYRDLQRCLGYPRFWITNSQAQARCMSGVGLGYFGVAAGPGVRILDEQGLPNREVATAPVLWRWRPGHEHYVSFDQVLERRALFCSTGEPGYDAAMATRAGVLIHLDPDLLSSVPDIENRLARLAQLKAEGSPVIPRLERAYDVTIADLRTALEDIDDDPASRRRQACWNAFEEDTTVFFY